MEDSQGNLFTTGAPKVWTIPPGADFLGALAATLAEQTGLRDNPAALADALIYVPNSRSARALALALYKAAGGKTILPPDIRTLGDLENDEPPSGAEEALTDLGPPLSASTRLGTLAMLVAKFYEARGIPLPPASALAGARELGRLLDSAALTGDVDWSKLPTLVEDADLAVHWKDSVEFLKIVTAQWPEWLAQNGATEPFERRLIVAKAIAAALRQTPPKAQFIIAGSTGATPASRTLMQVATELSGGLVVLPGLDRDAPDQMWQEISARPQEGFEGAPDHPQFSLAGTLQMLGLRAPDVPIWPGVIDTPQASARRRLVHESLAPAIQTADWLKRLKNMSAPQSEATFAANALSGLTVLEAVDDAQEALMAALCLREALETPGQTAALITPDATLARQVGAILKRWNVHVPPSGGIPLGRTRAGALMLLALNWARDTGHPVALASLLKHPALGRDKASIALLETSYLRGARLWENIDSLIAALPARTEAAEESRHTKLTPGALENAHALLAPLQAIAKTATLFENPDAPVSGAVATESLIRLINALVGDDMAPWSGNDGQSASACIEAAGEVTAQLSGLTIAGFAAILESLASVATVPDTAPSHPRLNIWGPLEARLQQPDRIILAGLNETVWPNRPPADAFLPRRFRKELGLPAPEARLGLAAHDFAQLATSPNVTMLYSARRDDAPAVASRWILRLKTLSEGALGKAEAQKALAPRPAHDPRIWAKALTKDTQTCPPGLAEPKPSPPVRARPAQLSVTRIDTLQRDPYSIYAGHILGLKKLDALNAPLDARPRGTAIHKALEDFENASTSLQNASALHQRFLDELQAAGEPSHLILSNRAPLGKAAEAYFNWWKERQKNLISVWPEVKGAIEFNIEGTPFKLTGIADRIEKQKDGTYVIIDFKTGEGKSRTQIVSGFEQQLPLLAILARDGKLKSTDQKTIPSALTSAFGYVSVRYDFKASLITKGAEDATELTDNAKETLLKLIGEYRKPDAEFRSIPRVAVKSQYDGDYDRLARRAEWAGDTSSSGED